MPKKLFSLCAIFLFLFPPMLSAHGSMEIPVSRVYFCFREGPENLKSEACKAMITLGEGKQALYDWDMINQFNANDKHRDNIPDGTLCAGGRDKYAGLNLARSDWPTTTITPDANGKFNFVFRATVPHATRYFELYLTKDSYDVTQPLKWSDLEDTPFCRITDVLLENGRYNFNCDLPKKSGRRILYMIWQRSDSAEAFYSCSDVILGASPPTQWKALDNLTVANDVLPRTTLVFWLMKNCEDIESWSVPLLDGQHTATLWPYYLAKGVNAHSKLVNIGELNVTTGNVEPVQNAIGNKVYIRDTDLSAYFFIIDYIHPGQLMTGSSAENRRQQCLNARLPGHGQPVK